MKNTLQKKIENKKTSTAECVSNGHPDKVADIIADAIVDAYMQEDRNAMMGVKTLVSSDLIVISGEIGSHATVDIEEVVRESLRELGFDGEKETFNGLTCPIIIKYNDKRHELEDPNRTVFFEQGAADQCLAVGYACNETNLLLPAAPMLARALIDQLDISREHLPYLRKDAKSLVTVSFTDAIPHIDSVLLSTEHEPGFDVQKLRRDIEDTVISGALGNLIKEDTKIIVNPIGHFENAGPYAETGLSGRKVVVDAYGDAAPVGGGAFSGKDPSKCDRSATYYARYVAKSIVSNGLAQECTVKISYGIGISRPLSLEIDANGSDLSNQELKKLVERNFHFTPRSICNQLGLFDLSYQALTKQGHFGHSSLPWEKARYICRD